MDTKYDVREFLDLYDVNQMLEILESTNDLYGWQKENLLAEFIDFRSKVQRALKYHNTQEK